MPPDPAPSDPALPDPAPSDPALPDPAPSDPAPSDPAPSDPGPSDPGLPDHTAAVARAMAGLDGLADRPLAEHVEVFERVHAALGGALAAGSA